MANPNKTVAAARRRLGGFPPKPDNPARDPNNDPFMAFIFAQSRAGVSFGTEAEAREAFARLPVTDTELPGAA